MVLEAGVDRAGEDGDLVGARPPRPRAARRASPGAPRRRRRRSTRAARRWPAARVLRAALRPARCRRGGGSARRGARRPARVASSGPSSTTRTSTSGGARLRRRSRPARPPDRRRGAGWGWRRRPARHAHVSFASPVVLFLHNRYRVTGGEERAVEDLRWLLREHLGEEVELLERDSAALGRSRAAVALLRGGPAARRRGRRRAPHGRARGQRAQRQSGLRLARAGRRARGGRARRAAPAQLPPGVRGGDVLQQPRARTACAARAATRCPACA